MTTDAVRRARRWVLYGAALWIDLRVLVRYLLRHRDRSITGFAAFCARVMVYGGILLLAHVAWGRRVRAIALAYGWARRVDDVADGNDRLPQGMTLDSYLANKRELVNLACAPEMVLARASFEDVPLACLFLDAQKLGVSVRQCLLRLWAHFEADCRRGVAGTLASDIELESRAMSQDLHLFAFGAAVLSGDAWRLGSLAIHTRGMFSRIDWLADVESDLRRGYVTISREAIRAHDIDVPAIRSAVSWVELRAVRGFARWYRDEARKLAHDWEYHASEVRDTLSRVARGPFRRLAIAIFLWEFGRAVRCIGQRAL